MGRKIKSSYNFYLIMFGVLLSFLFFPTLYASNPAPGAMQGNGFRVQAITTPSDDVTLSFVRPGRIDNIAFKAGQPVRKGQVIVGLYKAVEEVQLAQIKSESDNESSVLASKAQLDQAKVKLEIVEQASQNSAATELELQQAKLDVTIAELSLEIAKLEHEQSKLKYEEAKLQIENMSLKSPIDGRIVELFAQVGESVNALQDVVQVVRIDPLWIDVPVPLANSTNLALGQKAKVIFSDKNNITSEGSIIYISPVADPGSETLKIRLEAPNKTARPAGERVTVILGE